MMVWVQEGADLDGSNVSHSTACEPTFSLMYDERGGGWVKVYNQNRIYILMFLFFDYQYATLRSCILVKANYLLVRTKAFKC